jgi:hypothetical protein
MPPHPISLWSIVILSTHLCLGLPSGNYPSGFPTDILYAFLFSTICGTCPTHVILLHLNILITFVKEYKLRSSSLCSFLQSPVTSSLFGPNILLSTLCSNTLSLCSSLNVRDHRKNYSFVYSKKLALCILTKYGENFCKCALRQKRRMLLPQCQANSNIYVHFMEALSWSHQQNIIHTSMQHTKPYCQISF